MASLLVLFSTLYTFIGGFRDTYLGRQVVSSEARRAESGNGVSWESGAALRTPAAGSGAEPQPKSNLVPF